LQKQTGGFVLGARSGDPRNARLSGLAVFLPQGKIPLGNLTLTMISVWLGT
jgi:hypothetical protein